MSGDRTPSIKTIIPRNDSWVSDMEAGCGLKSASPAFRAEFSQRAFSIEDAAGMHCAKHQKFKCVACGRITFQPIDEDHPSHEIRSWCCGVRMVIA